MSVIIVCDNCGQRYNASHRSTIGMPIAPDSWRWQDLERLKMLCGDCIAVRDAALESRRVRARQPKGEGE